MTDSAPPTHGEDARTPDAHLSDDRRLGLFNQVMTTWLVPEIERRQARGEAATPFPLRFAQVVFYVGRPPVVRLNEEVRGKALARLSDLSRPKRAGDDVYVDDIAAIEGFELPAEDADAAHITLFWRSDRYSLAFDATYNKARIADHLAVAQEFIESAEHALANGHLHAFAENAFEAAELLAKAELLPFPDERLLDAKKHGTIAARLHWWAKLGNIDPSSAVTLSRLEALRTSSRYLRGGDRLQQPEAGALFHQLLLMRDHVTTLAPKPGATEQPRRTVQMIAARPVQSGSFVGPGDNLMP